MTLCSTPHERSSRPSSAQRWMTASQVVAVRLARRAVLHELDADHEAGPADVADPRVAGGDLPQPGRELRPAGGGVRHEVALADLLEDREAGGAGDRVAAERRAVGALAPALLERPRAGHRRERQAVRDRLGHADDVGDDPGVLEGPHPPGPPEAGLDLVGDEQDPVPVADVRAGSAGSAAAPGRSRPRPGPARRRSPRPPRGRSSSGRGRAGAGRPTSTARASSPPKSR